MLDQIKQEPKDNVIQLFMQDNQFNLILIEQKSKYIFTNIFGNQRWIILISLLEQSEQQIKFITDIQIQKWQYFWWIFSLLMAIKFEQLCLGQYIVIIFISQTHNQIYPLKGDAFYYYKQYEPTFGGNFYEGSHDIYIDANVKDGYSNLGTSYKCDQYQIINQKLFGQGIPNIIECEIYQVIYA